MASARRRPLFVLPDLNAGGAERSTLQLLGDLARSGWEPTLFLLRRRGEFLGELPRGVGLAWALEGDARIHRHAPAVAWKLAQRARGCDVVVGALEHEAAYFALLCARLLRKPAIAWVHAVMGEHLQELSPAHTRLARLVYPRMDRLVFPSQAAADSLAGVARLRPGLAAVIPSYVDVAALELRGREPLAQWAQEVFARPTVISVGRLVPSKGLDTLLRAHALVRREGIDHHLLIVGEGPMRGELAALADALGVRGSVFLPGFVPNPWSLMRVADIFALASRFEGLSVVLLEALALGVAIVATDCPGGPAEVLERGRYGLMVPPDDAAALAAGMARLLREGAMRDTLRAQGPERARDFSREAVLPRWAALLDGIG